MATPQLWPIFICYRRADGHVAARRVYEMLDGFQTVGTGDEPVQLDAYLDEAVPGVEDWQAFHKPYLEKSRAIIVICTPGAKLNEGPEDWVHREIDWWLKEKTAAPILIDPLMEGVRYVPSQIVDRWENIQRISLVEKEWSSLTDAEREEKTAAIRHQILGTILPSAVEIYAQELNAERRRARWLRNALAAAVTLLVVAIILFSYARQQAQLAEREQGLAQSREFAAISREFRDRDPAVALDYAIRSAERAETIQAGAALSAALSIQKTRLILRHHARLVHAAFSPDDTQIVTASEDNSARVWDASTGELKHELGHDGPVHHAAFSPDGTQVVTASGDGTGRVWDAASGQQLHELGSGGSVFHAAFSPGGRQIVTASEDGTGRGVGRGKRPAAARAGRARDLRRARSVLVGRHPDCNRQ